jgi:anti-sigma factor RsiW
MSEMNHERARKLLITAAVEEIAPSDRVWLEDHLAGCPNCAQEAQELRTAVESVHGAFNVSASPELVENTKRAVRRRLEVLKSEPARSTPIWIATALSSGCMILTTPYVWRTFEWIGRIANLPDGAWELGFLMWWFLPATVLAAAVAWRRGKENVWNWVSENPWGQQ